MSGQKPLRLFLICDHPILRTGYRKLLEDAVRAQLVGDSGYETAAGEIRNADANVILLHVSPYNDDARPVAKRLKDALPDTCLLLISNKSHIPEEKIRRAEADGHIARVSHMECEEFVTAIIEHVDY